MRWKAFLLVLAVFLLGMVVGGLGVHVMGTRAASPPLPPPATGADVVKQLDEQCSLTADQEKQIRAIMEDVMSQYRQIYEPIKPQIEEVRQSGRQRIRALLTAEQLPKFEEWLRRMDEERKKEEQEHK